MPSLDEIKKITANTVMPLPRPAERWSWWCLESFDPPKRTICLHVMRGREERELRWNVPTNYYHEKKVMVTRAPVTGIDRFEKEIGVWDEIADQMETWPELDRIVEAMTADMLERLPHA